MNPAFPKLNVQCRQDCLPCRTLAENPLNRSDVRRPRRRSIHKSTIIHHPNGIKRGINPPIHRIHSHILTLRRILEKAIIDPVALQMRLNACGFNNIELAPICCVQRCLESPTCLGHIHYHEGPVYRREEGTVREDFRIKPGAPALRARFHKDPNVGWE